MKISHASKHSTSIGIIFMVVAAVCAGAWTVSALQPKGRFNCESFGSYADIPLNWQKTMPQLDGGKHNGVPCETLKKQHG